MVEIGLTLSLVLLMSLAISHGHWERDPLEIFAFDNANYSGNLFCRCDSVCAEVGDCCLNCPEIMDSPTLESVRHDLQARCFYVPEINRPILVSYGCPTDYVSDPIIRNCEMTGFMNASHSYIDETGLLYPSIDCAICNRKQVSMTFSVRGGKKFNYDRLRFCHPSVDFCSIRGMSIWNRSLSELCYRFSAPVMTTNTPVVVYKNIFCALCNGTPLERLFPFPTFDNYDNYMLAIFQEPAEFGAKTGPQPNKLKLSRDEIPAAFSILLNFGLDGKENLMFSSSDAEKIRRKQEQCGLHLIWDPFSQKCRQLYCSVEYVLVNFQCVRKVNGSQSYDKDASNLPIYQTEPENVQLRLSLQTSALELMQYSGTKRKRRNLCDDLRLSLSSIYKINPGRIQDMNLTTELPDFNEQPTDNDNKTSDEGYDFDDDLTELLNNLENSLHVKVNFSAKFYLQEASDLQKTEPSVNKVVNQMVSSVSTGTFNIEIRNINAKVFAIHQDSPFLKSWCSPLTGSRRVVYWYDEFHLVLYSNSSSNENWVKEVYVNKTGITYTKGNFVANILFQGIEGEHGNVDISGYVIVCERQLLDASCSRVLLNEGEYAILPNASVEYFGSENRGLNLSVFEPGRNGSIFVCFDSTSIIQAFTLSFNTNQEFVSLILLIISVVSLGFVLLTYTIFSELRNLPGCNTFNLTLSLFLSQVLFLVSQRKSVDGYNCKVFGALLHYLILTSFFWMNVMAYDLYRTFGQKNLLAFIRHKNTYLPRYMAYAYLIPGAIIGVSVYLDTFDNKVQPMYGYMDNCWIANPLAAFTLFAAPIAVILLTNLVFYVLTISSISQVHHKIDSKINDHKPAHGKKDVLLGLKIISTMGFTWIFGFLAAILDTNTPILTEIFVYLFIVFNTLQGLFIFFAFVCNGRVFGLYQKALFTLRTSTSSRIKCSHCGQTFCVCNVKTGMKRSPSTETNVSVLSVQE